MSITQEFKIDIMVGTKLVANLFFKIESDTNEGIVVSKTVEPIFYKELHPLLESFSRIWKWNEFVKEVIQKLTMETGGRFILRFFETPANDGRDENNRTLKRYIDRVNT